VNANDYTIGIDLGGSSIKAVAATPQGETRFRENVSFQAGGKMDWGEKIKQLVLRFEEACGRAAQGIGVSAPGLAAADGRSISYMPGRLHGLEGLDWKEYLGFSKAVPVMNDAHSALLGESWLGAARGFQHAILLTLGTGVGGAAIVDGKLLRGNIGRAGHLGHCSLDPDGLRDICGTPGSLELAMGNCTILERSRGQFQTTHELVTAYLAGDSFAAGVWLKSVRDLAAAICSFINILDPEAVIIGGGIARSGKSLFDPLGKFLEPIEWRPGGHRVQILPAQLGEFAGAFGAACNALPQD
jgi:glucokinase